MANICNSLETVSIINVECQYHFQSIKKIGAIMLKGLKQVQGVPKNGGKIILT